MHLLKHGSDDPNAGALQVVKDSINAPDAHGWSPLHVACRNGAAEMVKQLLAAGAALKARTR